MAGGNLQGANRPDTYFSVHQYWRDFPTVCPQSMEKAKTRQCSSNTKGKLLTYGMKIQPEPPNLFKTLEQILDGNLGAPFPVLNGVTDRTKHLLMVFALYASRGQIVDPSKVYSVKHRKSENSSGMEDESDTKVIEADPKLKSAGRIIDYLVSNGYNSWNVESVPIGFILPILASEYECRLRPPNVSWNKEAYVLIGKI